MEEMKVEEQNKLYAGNLPYSVTSESLKDLFAECGTVVDSAVISDKFSNRSKGFGFVTMSSAEEATKAVETLNGKEIDGRKIVVNNSRPREQRPRSGDRGGDRGGSRGGGRRERY